jgi:hypothetical protein
LARDQRYRTVVTPVSADEPTFPAAS